jgi:tetratricopeptide (TPR) repeat protein
VAEVEVAENGWHLHTVVAARVGATGDEVIWERLAESSPRIQSLLATCAESAAQAQGARLQAELWSEVERLLGSAAVLARSGEWDEATTVLQQALALSPDNEQAQRLLQRVRAGQEEKHRSRKEEDDRLREAARQALADGDLARLEQLAARAGLAHLDDLAKELTVRLWEAQEGSLPVEELFALALERLGEDPERAGRLLQAVLRRQPDHPEAGFYLELAASATGAIQKE